MTFNANVKMEKRTRFNASCKAKRDNPPQYILRRIWFYVKIHDGGG